MQFRALITVHSVRLTPCPPARPEKAADLRKQTLRTSSWCTSTPFSAVLAGSRQVRAPDLLHFIQSMSSAPSRHNPLTQRNGPDLGRVIAEPMRRGGRSRWSASPVGATSMEVVACEPSGSRHIALSRSVPWPTVISICTRAAGPRRTIERVYGHGDLAVDSQRVRAAPPGSARSFRHDLPQIQ